MSELYNKIAALCQQQGVSVGKMCNQLGISRGNLTELKMERIKTLKTDNLTKIAVYFNVSVDYLLGNEEKPAPAQEGWQKDNPLIALYGEVGEYLDDDDMDDIATLMRLRAEIKKKQKE